MNSQGRGITLKLQSMKKFSAREVVGLTLPVVVLGGGAWWMGRGGSLATLRGAPSDIYKGKPRLEFGKIEPTTLSSWDVAQGFVWGFKTDIWQGGKAPLSDTAKRCAFIAGSTKAGVFYRVGSTWKEAHSPDGTPLIKDFGALDGEQEFGNFAVHRGVNLKVMLKGVPRNAEEIRLRGHFFYENAYTGSDCVGTIPGPGWKMYLPNCYYTTNSRVFDLPIKTASGQWPIPNVSRTTNLQLMGAYWIYEPNMYSLVLRLRDPSGVLKQANPGGISVQNFSLRDRNNKEIILYSIGIKPPQRLSTSRFNFIDRRALNSALPSDQYVAAIGLSTQPKGGWGSVKGPLHLRAEISDGESWPTSIDVKIPLTHGSLQEIGAP